MIKKITILMMAIFLVAAAAGAADLYFIKIGNRAELSRVKEIVTTARGNIDGRFLVDLNEDQVQKLRTRGIVAELAIPDFVPEKIFLVSKIHPEFPSKAINFKSLYTLGNDQLAELNPGDLKAMRENGYVAIPLESLKTPLFYMPPVLSYQPEQSYPSDTIAEYIVQDSLYSYDSRLQAFQTRYIYSDSVSAARTWIVNKFHSFGYTNVSYDTFNYNGYPCHNVICIKTGTTEPDKIIVIGGHYDSINFDSDPMFFAPGADDNGSGTSAVLEIARVLKNVSLNKTVMFVAFSAEEVGLVGSDFIAASLKNQNADVEFMLNFDMIGYTTDAVPDANLFSGPFRAYADLMADAGRRVTDLQPIFAGAASNSDHASFVKYGYYAVFAEEGDFNTQGWHTNTDSTSKMDFPYMTKIVKMGIAGLCQVDNAARPTRIDNIFDAGDGQGLRVDWHTDYRPTYTYKIYYGTDSANLDNMVDVPPSTSYYDLTGLTEGQLYYITVLGTNAAGYGPVYLELASETPLVVPRTPASFVADLDTGKISLTWRASRELDIDHYQLMRKSAISSWDILEPNLTDTFYVDHMVLSHVQYDYRITAFDHDLNQSSPSPIASAVPASFDGGILFVEETASGGVNPSETKQTYFYDSIFAGQPRYKYKITSSVQKMSRSLSGQYSSVIWMDDDFTQHLLSGSLDSLAWYMRYPTDVFLAGVQTISWITGTYPLGPGNFFYDNFGVSQATENSAMDFIGATGLNGWPDLHTATDNTFSGFLPSIAIFAARPGAQVIYTYNSNSGNPTFQGQPAGLIYETPQGKRIALSFPVCQLREADAQALMAKVFEYFGEVVGSHPYGDVTGDDLVNISDIIYIINYLYRGGPAPIDANFADVDHSCGINVKDISYLIKYLYLDGPAPKAGCAHP